MHKLLKTLAILAIWTAASISTTTLAFGPYLPYVGPWFAGGGNDEYTVLLLHMDGTDASTTFPDSSTGGAGSPHTATANGNAQIDTAQSKFGTASGLFDGDGDYLSIPDSADWDFGSGDFTIDFWVRFSVHYPGWIRFVGEGNGAVNPSVKTGWSIIYNDDLNLMAFYAYNGSSDTYLPVSWSPSTDTWYHVAVVRSSDTLRYYVAGSQVGSDQSVSGKTFNRQTSNGVQLSRYTTAEVDNHQYFNGHIDELRISKGIARWTSNFTPPTAPYGP